MFNFRMDADTPEIREAVQKTIEKLKHEFRSYTFTAEFGKGGLDYGCFCNNHRSAK